MDEGVELGIDHAQRPIGRTLAAGNGEIAPDQGGAYELEAVDVRACRGGSDPDKSFVEPVAIGIDADRSGDLHVLVIAEEPGEADVEPVVEQRGLTAQFIAVHRFGFEAKELELIVEIPVAVTVEIGRSAGLAARVKPAALEADRKSVVWGQSGEVRVNTGGGS